LVPLGQGKTDFLFSSQKQAALYEQYKLRRAKSHYVPEVWFRSLCPAKIPLTTLDCVAYRLATGASANYNHSRHVLLRPQPSW